MDSSDFFLVVGLDVGRYRRGPLRHGSHYVRCVLWGEVDEAVCDTVLGDFGDGSESFVVPQGFVGWDESAAPVRAAFVCGLYDAGLRLM